MEPARNFCENLTKNTDHIVAFLQELAATKKTIYFWTQEDDDGLARLLGSLMGSHHPQSANVSIRLLCRHRPLGWISGPEALLYLWQPPLLTEKHKAISDNVMVLRQTARCITTPQQGPQQALPTVAVISSGANPRGRLLAVQSKQASPLPPPCLCIRG